VQQCVNTDQFGVEKRGVEHKGLKATGIKLKLPTSTESEKIEEDGDNCVVVSDGYVCRRKPVSGRKRCEEHIGRRITVMLPRSSIEGFVERKNLAVCGVGLGDGSTCVRNPVPGRKRCELHKDRRIT